MWVNAKQLWEYICYFNMNGDTLIQSFSFYLAIWFESISNHFSFSHSYLYLIFYWNDTSLSGSSIISYGLDWLYLQNLYFVPNFQRGSKFQRPIISNGASNKCSVRDHKVVDHKLMWLCWKEIFLICFLFLLKMKDSKL